MFESLYIKTNYTLLSSLISIDSLIEYALKNGIKTLSICDDNMNSTMIFYDKCLKNNIKPIIGLDIKYNSKNLLLYALNNEGYKSLIKLSTISSERDININDLKENNKSVILILPYDSFSLISEIGLFYETKYIGVLNKNEEKDVLNNNYSPVLLNKILYLEKKYSNYIKYLFMIRDSKSISDDVIFNDNYNYFISNEIAYSLVSKLSIENSINIACQCNIKFKKRNDLLPVYDSSLDSNEYLTKLSLIGLSKRLEGNPTNVYKERLKYELDVIKNMGFSNYFLVVYDFIKYAKKNNILVGPGRGSAAGSLVAYTLGITEVDPIKYDLLFERFLNPERVTMPDIDTDFPDIYRQDIIDYVREKYGLRRVSGIITFGTMAPKLVLRDVGRVLNIPLKTIDLLCKCIPQVTKLKLKDFYKDNSNFKNLIDSSEKMTLLYKISSLIEGFPRHSSIHAAGIVMSRVDLDEIIPLVKNDDMYVSGYTMEYLESLGLLKMDFLGIKNLTTIMNIISDIEKYEKVKIDFSYIPLDDEETINIFTNANTCGIFQFESDGMKNFLRKLRPTNLNDIFAAIALFRPGPAVNIDSYIRRKNGIEKIEYIDETLKSILESTYGIIIYQEQIMQIASTMAGYSLGEADVLRRAMSKKKIEILKSEEDKFIKGSLARGYTEEISKKVFNLILNFANYGFNKSHSVCYSIVAYKMAYLKAKYPKYFFSNLLSSVIGNEEKTLEYINEARKLGLNILLPDINKSSNKYEVVDDGLLYPISNIKGVGVITCKDIINSRNQKFNDIYDCFSKIFRRNINKAILETLIKSSCFDCFGFNKQTLMYNLDSLINYAQLTKDLDPDFVIKPEIEIKDEYTKDILLSYEKEAFGIYLTNHPTTLKKSKLDCNYINVEDITKNFNKNVNIVVLIEKVRVTRTKNSDKMAFLLTSDNTGQIDVILFPKIYNQFNNIDKGSIILVNGQIQRRQDKYQIIANKIKIL
ncbi:MAG: DNA polymerase III subunit alpha [bacterium]|nr:DNA polymerase III subunit alpha [bacterium]